MKKTLVLVLLAIGLCADVLATEQTDYPQITFVFPKTGGLTLPREQFVMLVVEAGFISHENTPLPSDGTVEYVNNLLKAKSVSYLAVHVREGTKYGELVRALDILRKTTAKSIGVSMTELPVGRNP